MCEMEGLEDIIWRWSRGDEDVLWERHKEKVRKKWFLSIGLFL